MTDGLKFYKLKLIKKLLYCANNARSQLFNELAVNATNPTIVKRRIRMIKHINLYENQLIEKIQNFETDDVSDLNSFDPDRAIKNIINRSA